MTAFLAFDETQIGLRLINSATRNGHIVVLQVPNGLCSGEVAMVVLDWRSEQDYANFEKAETADIAWEWLRRDSEYQREFRNLTSAAQSNRTPHQFRQKWGLSFRGRS